MKLDKTDKLLIYELLKDAKQPYHKLGKKLGKTKQAINYRKKGLEKNNIIKGYDLDINVRKLGYNVFNLLIECKNKEDEIVEFLKASKKVIYLVRTIGSWNIYASVISENTYDFYNFLESLHNKYKENIQNEVINLEVSGVSNSFNFLVNKVEKYDEKELEQQTKVDLKDSDKKILTALKESPSSPLIKISQKTSFSYLTIKSSIENMTNNGVIKGFRADINTKKLGYERYLFLIETNTSTQNLKKIRGYLLSHQNIVYVIELIGKLNFILDAYVKDIDELTKIIRSIKETFKDDIKIDFLRVIESKKENFNFN